MKCYLNRVANFLAYFFVDLLKIYFFLWLILNIFRWVFLIFMYDYIDKGTTFDIILNAIIAGGKLSFQSAGFLSLTFLPFIFLRKIFKSMGNFLFFLWSYIVIFITTLLFVARFPFYKVYLSNYNQMIFTALHEDKKALFFTFYEQYNLVSNLILVLAISVAIGFLFKKYISCPKLFLYLTKLNTYFVVSLLSFAIYFVGTISLYGGGFSWRSGVNWENAGITKDSFLNEIILDDYEAIYRAHITFSRQSSMTGLNYQKDEILYYANFLYHKSGSDDLKYYLEKKAKGSIIKKPKHIFIILSESYANWPLLPSYENLKLAEGMKSLIKNEDAFYSGNMLPAGSSTVGALMTMVTGLSQSNLYLTNMEVALEKPYITATSTQMEKLGYTTSFWYAGPSSWENIERFTKSQGFQNFYSRGNIKEDTKGSVWGADDEFLYRDILAKTKDDENTFTMILTTSNHSPFNVDLEKAKFPKDFVRGNLPKQYQDDEELLKELGHFWYADKEMSQFIKKAKEKFKDSLFIVMGDHGDRYNIDKTPNMYERYAIPFIIIGDGITKNTFPEDMAGSQMDVIPTLIELIAPKGFIYYAIGKSLTENKIGQNYSFFITGNAIGNTGEFDKEPYYFRKDNKDVDLNYIKNYVNGIRAISSYIGKYNSTILK